jgi:hypothetical protein
MPKPQLLCLPKNISLPYRSHTPEFIGVTAGSSALREYPAALCPIPRGVLSFSAGAGANRTCAKTVRHIRYAGHALQFFRKLPTFLVLPCIVYSMSSRHQLGSDGGESGGASMLRSREFGLRRPRESA